ncbi:ATP-binding protein, partial [Salmonella enterica]|nr:ATP-binding protein [Salmonella enterica]
MADLVDTLSERMDTLTAERFGITVSINGTGHIAVES